MNPPTDNTTTPVSTPVSPDTDTCVTHRVMAPFICFWMSLIDGFILDAVFKYLVLQQPLGAGVVILPNVLQLYHAKNQGVAFGWLGAGETPYLPLVLSGLLISSMFWFMLRQPFPSTRYALGAGMILGGGINNFFDRLITGAVTDYIYIPFLDFPVFNLSDALIFIGFLLVFRELLPQLLFPSARR
jgi:signal peptidase II